MAGLSMVCLADLGISGNFRRVGGPTEADG